MEKTNPQLEDPIVLFDGICNFCNASVNFLMKNSKSSSLKFSSLQGETIQKIASKNKIDSFPDSIVFYEKGNFYVESEAFFQILRHIKAPYSWMRVFRILPLTISNSLYRLIARNRYRWFGKREQCRIPEAHELERLLP